MSQTLLRNLDQDLLDDYRAAATRNRRSLNAELKEGLQRARPVPSRLSASELRALSEELWAMAPSSARMTDSTAYIRWMRDTNGGDWGEPFDDDNRP